MASHAGGKEVLTDMPRELGGSGDQVSPGWLLRAGVASCAATTIAMAAARDGIELETLEVKTTSRSDSRGFLGMTEADGKAIYPGPLDLTMTVRIGARGVAPEKLRRLVESSSGCAPMSAAITTAVPMDLKIEIEALRETA